MKVYLLTHTDHPERVVAAAAKLCYSDIEIESLLDGIPDDESARVTNMLRELGHESPVEHVSFTFAVEGVSRSLLAQITRHRHASFSVQSQRYVRYDSPRYIVPPAVERDEEAFGIFKESMERAASDYKRIAGILKEKYTEESIKSGIPSEKASAPAEKKAIEDARFALPNAGDTKFVMTMNARSLINFFKQRCCERAQWEIKALADEILRLVYPIAPGIFETSGPGCVSGTCPEGKMSCAGQDTTRKFYTELKKEARNG